MVIELLVHESRRTVTPAIVPVKSHLPTAIKVIQGAILPDWRNRSAGVKIVNCVHRSRSFAYGCPNDSCFESAGRSRFNFNEGEAVFFEVLW